MIETAQLRARHRREGIEPDGLADDPLEHFRAWHAEWQAVEPHDAAAAVLATSDANHRPTVRTVDIARVDDGFVFLTSYGSRKGLNLAVNPWAALSFLWLELDRQVEVGGWVERLAAVESDAFFALQPRPLQLLAWASDQSRELDDRALLDERLAEADDRFDGQEIPRPRSWGGLRLVPDELEFWQGRAAGLNDRVRYRRAGPDEPWARRRLSP